MSDTNMVMAARFTSPKRKAVELLSEFRSIVAEEEDLVKALADLVKELAECRESRVDIEQRLREAYGERAARAIHQIKHGIQASSEEEDVDATDDSISD
jgi:hypothetical protein